MSRRFFDLAVATRRRVSRSNGRSFSLRLAIIVDLAYVGAGAVGGVAVSHHLTTPVPPVVHDRSPSCLAPGQRNGGSPPVIFDDWYRRWVLDKTQA
jgi:hypothetical protein